MYEKKLTGSLHGSSTPFALMPPGLALVELGIWAFFLGAVTTALQAP